MAREQMKIDPRARLAVVAVLSTLAIIIKDAAWLAALAAITVLMLAIGRFDIGRLLPRLKRFWSLFLALTVIQSVFIHSGRPLVAAAGVTLVTTHGLAAGVSIILRLAIIVLSAAFIIAAEPMELVLGLVAMRIPFEIAFMVLLAIRFLPVLAEEMQDTVTAVQLRGVELKRIPAGAKLRLYTSIFLPVVAGALLRARKAAVSMEARAFRAYPQRTYLDELHWQRSDMLLTAGALLAGIIFYILYLGR